MDLNKILHNKIKVYFIIGLRKSGNHFFIENLITQLSQNNNDILFLNDVYTTTKTTIPLYQNELNNSLFHNNIIDNCLINNSIYEYNIKQLKNIIKYVIISFEDKDINKINTFNINSNNIQYIYIFRNIKDIIYSRYDYIINKFVQGKFNKSFKLQYKKYNKSCPSLDANDIFNIINIELTQNTIDYNKIINLTPCLYNVIYNSNNDNKIMYFNQIKLMLVDEYIFNIYRNYITQFNNDNGIMFNYTAYINNKTLNTDIKYMVQLFNKLGVKFDEKIYNNVKNITPHFGESIIFNKTSRNKKYKTILNDYKINNLYKYNIE